MWSSQLPQHLLHTFAEVAETIYDLTGEGRPFVWQEEQQQAFDTIKKRMINPPNSVFA